MAAAQLMSSDWFHEQHLAPWLPRLCLVAINAADDEAAHGDRRDAGMRRMTRKYGVAAYFDGLRVAEENLCLWYREGDGQDGSCAFEFLLACYLLSADTNLGHVVHPDKLGFRPTAAEDVARVARYAAEALSDARSTFSHRTCFTALWDLDPSGELDAEAGASAASRVKGVAACVLMLLSTHREFFEMKDAELAAAATRLARYKLEATGADLGDAAAALPAPNAAEVASARRADRMLREVLCGASDGSPSPYVWHVTRLMNRFAYPPAPPQRATRPVIVRTADDDDYMAVVDRAPSPVAHPCDEDAADCDLEGLADAMDGEDSSWDDDDGDYSTPPDYFPQSMDDGDDDEEGDPATDVDCPLYRMLIISWLK